MRAKIEQFVQEKGNKGKIPDAILLHQTVQLFREKQSGEKIWDEDFKKYFMEK